MFPLILSCCSQVPHCNLQDFVTSHSDNLFSYLPYFVDYLSSCFIGYILHMYRITQNYIINIIVHVFLRPQQSQLCARDEENSIVRVLYIHTDYILCIYIYTYSQPGGDSIWKFQTILTNILGKKPQKSNIYFSMNKHLHNYTHIKSIKPTIWIIFESLQKSPWNPLIFGHFF